MSSPGRPRMLDEMNRREICALVSAGDSLAGAAQYVGCSVRTIRREAERNEQFGHKLREAELAARLAPLKAMRKATETHWRAAAWMLERTRPEQFGPNALGPKELKTLARDLVRIVREEINDPMVLHLVQDRVRATIDYAMRHAWDRNRTGPVMRRAMRAFNRKGRYDGEYREVCEPLEASRGPAPHPPEDQWEGSAPAQPARDAPVRREPVSEEQVMNDRAEQLFAEDPEFERDCQEATARFNRIAALEAARDGRPVSQEDLARSLRKRLTKLMIQYADKMEQEAENAERHEKEPPPPGASFVTKNEVTEVGQNGAEARAA